jgi:hypothetical protein
MTGTVPVFAVVEWDSVSLSPTWTEPPWTVETPSARA